MVRFLACLMLLGCQGSPPASTEAPPPAAPTPPTPDTGLEARLAALGEVPLAVVLDPQGWPAVLAHLRSAWPTADLAFVDSPGAVVRLALGMEALPGLDPAAPIVAGLWAPPGPEVGGVASLLPLDRPPPGFRHTLLLPASDPVALAAALGAAKDKPERFQRFTERPHPLLGPLTVRVTPAADHVRVDVVTDGPPGTDPLPDAAPAPSAASRLVAQRGAAVAALLRPRLAAAALAQRGVHQVIAALEHVGPEHRAALQARGLAEVLGATRTLEVAHPEAGEYGVWLAADDAGLALEGVIALTALGHAIATAGVEGGGRLFAHEPAALAVALPFDAGAALARATPAFAPPLRDFLERWAMCGQACAVSWLLQAPFGLARGALDATPPAQRPPLPRSQQGVVRAADGPTGFAFAADLATGADTGRLAELWPKEAELHFVPVGDRMAALVGVRGDPRGVFTPEAPPPAAGPLLMLDGPALARVQVPPKRPRGPAGDEPPGEPTPAPPDVADFLNKIGLLRLDARLGAGGVRWRLHAAPTRQAPGPLAEPPTEPAPPPAPATPAARCLARAEATLAGALDAVAAAPPEQYALLLKMGVVGAQKDLACAAEDAALRPATEGLRAQLEALASAPPPPPPAVDLRQALDPPEPVLRELVTGRDPDGEDPAEVEALAPQHIQPVIRRSAAAFRHCYNTALMKQPELTGRVTLRLSIAPSGAVAAASADSADLAHTDIPACMANHAKRLKFPANRAGTTTQVSFPFVFSSAQ